MLQLPKKLGADTSTGDGGEWGGYYYQIIDPPQVGNWNGNNEFSLNWPLPAPADYATYTRMFTVLRSQGSYSLTNSSPVDSSTLVKPSLKPVIDQNGANLSESYTWNYLMYDLPPVTVQDWLDIDVSRPLDFFGFPTGILTWNLTVTVYGILWVRGTFDVLFYS